MAKEKGLRAEAIAAAFLEKQRGFRLIAKNVVFPFGELDLVADDKKTIVFIEVKYRASLSFGYPTEAVSRTKRKRIILAAQAFLQKYPHPLPDCRFDVVTLVGDLMDPAVEHFEDAFWSEDL